MFGLAALAAVAAMAFVGASSAMASGSTALCNNTSEPCNSVFTGHVEAKNVGTVELLGVANVKCTASKILGEALGLGAPLIIHVSELTFTSCSCPVSVIDKTGLIEGLWTAADTAGGTASGFEVLVECIGVHCIFGGVATGAVAKGGAPATITAKEVELKRLAGGFFCGSKAFWDATYQVVLPNPIHIAH
jgi:hypothetical protein